MKYDSLIDVLKDYHESDILIFEWFSGLKLKGFIDTLFETNNGFSEDDVNYKEYHAAVLRVTDILDKPSSQAEKAVLNWLERSSLLETSLNSNTPLIIYSEAGIPIWQYISELVYGISGLPERDKIKLSNLFEHNEWGIALEHLCAALYEERIKVPESIYKIIKKVGESMKMESSTWEQVEDLINKQ